jgi:adenylate cyclase
LSSPANSAFTYKRKSVDVKQVAQELGVRYVLEGSVRKAANRVRITGQLVDTATGAHIWADRFDGALDDIFDLQDQVASNIPGAIEPKLRQTEIERASRKPAANLTAYDLYLRALAQSYRFTEEGLAEAVVLARQALAIDPSYAPAAALIGRCRGRQRLQGWGALSAADVAEACRLARQALEAERDDAETIWQAAWTLFVLAGEAAMAAAALDRVLALNPNAAHAWLARGGIHARHNQPEAAIEAIERARRLSPFDPYTFHFTIVIAVAHLSMSATSSSRMATSSATASTLQPGSKRWPSRAGFASVPRRTSRCATASTLPSTISASSRSRTSQDRCAPIVSLSAHRPVRRCRSELRCRSPTSRRSQSCRFRT